MADELESRMERMFASRKQWLEKERRQQEEKDTETLVGLKAFLALRKNTVEPTIQMVAHHVNRHGYTAVIQSLDDTSRQDGHGVVLLVDSREANGLEDLPRFEIRYNRASQTVDIQTSSKYESDPLRSGLKLSDISRKVLEEDLMQWLESVFGY